MRRFYAGTVLLAALAAAATAAPPEVKPTLTVKPGQVVRIVVKGDKGIGFLKNFPDEAAFFEELAGGEKGERRFMFQAVDDKDQNKVKRVYVIGFWTEGEKTGVACTITVPAQEPIPPPPVIDDKKKTEPAPDPRPKPGPNDIPAPISEPGFRVLIVFDPLDTTLAAPKHAVVYGGKVRKALNDACVTAEDGTKAYRIYPVGTDASADAKGWDAANKRPMKSFPWIVISNGVTGYEGPVTTPEATIDLINLYKGK